VIYSYNKIQRDANISQIYFWNGTLRVSNSFSVHHQEYSTVHTGIDSYWWTEKLSETCRVPSQK